jgi:hypothetical protein
MSKRLLLAIALLIVFQASAQESSETPKKGSYLYYGQPEIEDNSMLIEEAFNQEAGVIQHISSFVFDRGEFVYNYTQEIPLADVKHQLAIGVSYASFEKPEGIDLLNSNYLTRGLGDVFISYRPMLMGKNDWALVIPRFTLIIPTGNARYGLGSGGWGGQFNMAVTKRLNSKITTHYNAGYTLLQKADFYSYSADGTPALEFQKNILSANLGASMIWLVHSKFNLMTEFTSLFGKAISDTGSLEKDNVSVINPGFRFAANIGKCQIVPGMGLPISFANGSFAGTGGFFYLSIEPNY